VLQALPPARLPAARPSPRCGGRPHPSRTGRPTLPVTVVTDRPTPAARPGEEHPP
jgi:hypothetical protein